MITKLLNTLSLFFGVSKSEVRGMMLLLLFCILMLVIPFVQKAIYASQSHSFNIIVDTSTISDSQRAHTYSYAHEEEEASAPTLQTLKRPIPINTISKAQLDSLGLPKRLVHNIARYLDKGGRFRKPDDLNKIYGIDASIAAHLAANTLWEAFSKPNPTTVPVAPVPKTVQKVDINTADTVTLEALRGIGHILAQRIVKYREKLGGFVSMEQLKEVYGISDFALSELGEKVFITKDFKPRLLKINQIKLEELSAHPYIGYKKSKPIFNYLKNHSKLADFDDFCKSYPFTDKELSFIKNYISYE